MASLRLVTMTIKAFRGKRTKHTNPRCKQAKKKGQSSHERQPNNNDYKKI